MTTGPTTVDLNGNTISRGYFSGVGVDAGGNVALDWAARELNGDWTADTQPVGDISSKIATTAFVAAAGGGGGGIRAMRVQTFVSSGTYTPDPHLLYALVEVLGGGGGGAGVSAATGASDCGGGGGAGGHAVSLLPASAIGASQAVTIGAKGTGGGFANPGTAGGTSSLGSLISCTGGVGGTHGGSTTLAGASSPNGGTGGVATGTTGVISATNGATGGYSIYGPTALGGVSGKGADSVWGIGGPSRTFNQSIAGASASGFGAGGGGGVAASAGNVIGGDGAPGKIVIIEYCSQ